MSKLFVDEIVHQSSQGSGTITIGASGETVALASGASASGNFGNLVLISSQTISSGTQTTVKIGGKGIVVIGDTANICGEVATGSSNVSAG